MVRSMKAGSRAASRRADQTENAVLGALMAAFMGVSPFVANVAGRWADATFSRAAHAQQATLRQVPRDSAAGCPRAQARGEGCSGYARAVAQPGRTAP